MKVTLLDGYTDEPARLGVPPFIAPGPRYLCGAVRASGNQAVYLSVDRYRREVKRGGDEERMKAFFGNSDVLVTILGALVPGTYLTTRPMSLKECKTAATLFKGNRIVVLTPGCENTEEAEELRNYYHHVVSKYAWNWLHSYLCGEERTEGGGKSGMVDQEFAMRGATDVGEMAVCPLEHTICEIDTYYGCHRYKSGGCSFCMEPSYGKPVYRRVEDIIQEIKELYSKGIRHFRLGGQSCILSYQSREGRPDPEALKKLFRGIRKSCPDIKTLHVDNADPSVVVTSEGKRAVSVIARYCTPGNVLAFGLESADPDVKEKNNLNTDPEQCLEAVRIVNRAGRDYGDNGMPLLLPGINFVLGLDGETETTLEKNMELLKKVRAEGLWLRRINIREVIGARKGFNSGKKWKGYRRDVAGFKKKVRNSIDGPLLEEMFPLGHRLRGLVSWIRKGIHTYCRQLGGYPIVVVVPYEIPLYHRFDISVTGHRKRSLEGIKTPFDLNSEPLGNLKGIPRIGKKRAAAIVVNRPYSSWEELKERTDIDRETIRSLTKLGAVIGQKASNNRDKD